MQYKQKLVNIVWYPEIEKLIDKTYGVSYDLPVELYDCNNGSYVMETVKPVALDEEQLRLMQEENPKFPAIDELLNDLCFRKLIEAGEWLIEVWW